LQDNAADLLFLDIQMPEMDGFAVLRATPPERLPVVVFVTAYDEYAIQAFEANAIDYLLKPFHRKRFFKALERAKQQANLRDLDQHRRRVRSVSESQLEPRLAIRSGRHTILLKPMEIDWIEAADNYACLHCGGKSHIVRETLASLETRLDRAAFVRIHRSAIVNSARVRELHPSCNGDYRVVLLDGTCLTLSRTHGEKLEVLLSDVRARKH
jgi:two-component system LytT family response regulator